MSQPVSEYELHLLVDGHLDPDRRAAIDAYLRDNPDEMKRIAAYRRQNQLLRALGTVLAAEMADENVPPSPPHRAGRAGRIAVAAGAKRWGRPALRAAALLVAASLGAAGEARWHAPPSLPAPPVLLSTPLGSFAPGIDAAESVAANGASAVTLDQVFDRRLGVPLNPPDLSEAGFTLVAQRLVPSVTGPAVQLLYCDKTGRRVTLLVAAAERQGDDSQPLPFYSWSNGRVSVALGGGVDGNELRTILATARRSLDPPPAKPDSPAPSHPDAAPT